MKCVKRIAVLLTAAVMAASRTGTTARGGTRLRYLSARRYFLSSAANGLYVSESS